jgi:hypothetical protein
VINPVVKTEVKQAEEPEEESSSIWWWILGIAGIALLI